jgi:hypothetical protein
MASKSLGTLTLDLVAKIGGFEAGLDKASRKSKKTSTDIAKHAKTIGIGVAAGVTAAAAGIAVMVSRQLDAIDAQAKMAQRLRTTFDSLTSLGRAGELAGVSMQQIEVASRSLDINLGRATQGAKAQTDAFAKLKLSADDIAKLPLDERIKAINTALKENVSETERAAVAADLFGSRGAAAIQQLTPETIAEAARQVEIFGLNLSDVDAAKVELANDALSTFGLLGDGIAQQITVQLAPALQALGEAFLDSAEEVGGLDNAVQDFVENTVKTVAFAVDAMSGFGRVVTVVAQGIRFLQFGSNDALAQIRAALETPLAGQALVDAWEKAKVAADKAAAAAIAARAGTEVAAGPSPEQAKAAEDAVKAAEKAAAALLKTFQTTEAGYEKQIALIGATTEAEKLRYEIAAGNLVGINEAQQDRLIALADELDAVEKLKQQQEDYTSLVKELRTDEEKLNDTLIARVAILKESGKLNSETAQRVVNDAFQAAPQFAGLAPEIGGAGGELRKVDAAQAELEAWYATQLEMLENYRKQEGSLNAEYDEKALALKKEHEKAIADIEYARQQASLVVTEELFGSLADAARVYAGEQSGIYKTLFAIQKAAAIAQSLVAIQTGIAQAAAAPFPANLAAMASVAAATASIIGNISAVSIGQAHDGIDSVPKSGTWNLEKGERVTTAKTSAKLDRTLSDVQSNMSGGGSSNIRIINAYDSGEVVGGYLGSKAGEKAIMNVVARNRRTIQSFAV